MAIFKKIWDKLLPPSHHRGVIEWKNPLDVPPEATVPMPLESAEDENLWREYIELDSRPAPLGKDTP